MRVSHLYKQEEPGIPDPEKSSGMRLVLWSVLGAAVILGIVLYFLHARDIPAILYGTR